MYTFYNTNPGYLNLGWGRYPYGEQQFCSRGHSPLVLPQGIRVVQALLHLQVCLPEELRKFMLTHAHKNVVCCAFRNCFTFRLVSLKKQGCTCWRMRTRTFFVMRIISASRECLTFRLVSLKKQESSCWGMRTRKFFVVRIIYKEKIL